MPFMSCSTCSAEKSEKEACSLSGRQSECKMLQFCVVMRPRGAFTAANIYLRHCYVMNLANSGPHAQESNVCVLGAGVMGLSVALRLRQVRRSWLALP